jgi:hypothetical protein
MASPSESTAQTCGEDDICQGAPESSLYLDLDNLPEVWVVNNSKGFFNCLLALDASGSNTQTFLLLVMVHVQCTCRLMHII